MRYPGDHEMERRRRETEERLRRETEERARLDAAERREVTLEAPGMSFLLDAIKKGKSSKKVAEPPPPPPPVFEEDALLRRARKKDQVALWDAVRQGDTDTVRRLTSTAGVDVNCHGRTGQGGSTPLHDAASEGGHLEIVKVLLAAGARVDAVDDCTEDTPLNLASYWGHLEIVDVLLAAGARVDLADYLGKKPIDVVCKGGNDQNKAAIQAALASQEPKATARKLETYRRMLRMGIPRGRAHSCRKLPSSRRMCQTIQCVLRHQSIS